MIESIKEILKKNPYIYIGRRWVLGKRNELLYLTLEKKERYIKKVFKKKVGYDIDFTQEPKTFNQKIQFRKLYDKNPLYSICADKYGVREYIKKKVGEEYLIPLYLVTDELTEEQWEKLPNSFVIKPTHDNGTYKIVKNKKKASFKKIRNIMKFALAVDYGKFSLEEFYSSIPRKILVEKYLAENIEDYRFHCFKKKIILEITETASRTSRMYNALTWEKLNVGNGYKIIEDEHYKPANFDKMLEIAKKLSEDFDYVRVDLYNVDGKIYVGELTFCESSGLGKFTDESWDYKFGSYWEQPKLK